MTDHITEPHEVPLKRCPKCKESKPFTFEYFPRNKGKKDGLELICKLCSSVQQRAWKEKHKERRAKQRRSYQVANKESIAKYAKAYAKIHKDRKSEYYRAYREANKDRRAEYLAEWRVANKEQKAEMDRLWRKANKEQHAINVNRYRSRKADAEGEYSAEDAARKYEEQGGLCYWCHVELGKTYTIDHVIPLSRGGSNWPENIVIACKPCNSSKNDKLPSEWKGRRRTDLD